MADTTFVNYSTVVPAAWLNDVNNLTYRGQFPLTTLSAAIGNVPLSSAAGGNSFYIYNNLNTGAVTSNSLLRITSVNRNASVQLQSIDAGGTGGFQWINQAGTFLGDMHLATSTGDIIWRAGGAVELMRLTAAGSHIMTGASSTLGYGTGSGGTVTQLTSKATTVVLNKGAGQITMINTALGATTTVAFTVTNSLVAATDVVVLSLAGGVASGDAYNYWIANVGAGSFRVSVRNITGGSLSEALVLNFAVIKGVTS